MKKSSLISFIFLMLIPWAFSKELDKELIDLMEKTHNFISGAEYEVSKSKPTEIPLCIDSGTLWIINFMWKSKDDKFNISLVNPKGKKIKPDNKKIKYFETTEEEGGLSSFFLLNPKFGMWKFVLSVDKSDQDACNISMMVMSDSTISTEGSLGQDIRIQQPILLNLKIKDENTPILNAEVIADIFDENNNFIEKVKLSDDGTNGDEKSNDGEYSFLYENTNKPGKYHIKYNITAKLNNGAVLTRTELAGYAVKIPVEIEILEITGESTVSKTAPYQLEIQVKVKNDHGVDFFLGAELYDQSGNKHISFARTRIEDNKKKQGIQTVTLSFNTDSIWEEKIDGPYLIKDFLAHPHSDQNGFPTFSKLTYLTKPYKASEFEYTRGNKGKRRWGPVYIIGKDGVRKLLEE
ncbi:MAG: hypothetical protein JW774_04350 [Candidatus Aureabacteria bacterium]|nr:hypothetical protein [Candidatus Auribacterota bacterium]